MNQLEPSEPAGAVAEHPHARLVRALWNAAAEGDREAMEALFSRDVVWHSSGRGRFAGDKQGPEAVFDYLGTLGELADEFRTELVDVLVGDARAAVLFRVHGERKGRQLDIDYLLLFAVRDGRIREVWSYPRDRAALEAFWA